MKTNIRFRLAADQNRDVQGWITSDGELITTRYEADFQHGQVLFRFISPETRVFFPQFCVEYGNSTEGILAVMCDPCKGSEVIDSFVLFICFSVSVFCHCQGTFYHLPSFASNIVV